MLQSYSTYVSEDHVILGNAAILRCHIPSFVADTVHVDHWLIDENIISSTSDWGINFHPSPLPSVPYWWRGGERERDRKMATGSSLKASSSVIFFCHFFNNDCWYSITCPHRQSWAKSTTRTSTKNMLFAATAPSSNANSLRSWLTTSKLNRGSLTTEPSLTILNSMVPVLLKWLSPINAPPPHPPQK